jgi:Zn2+/Cd2+-exporting ATPase
MGSPRREPRRPRGPWSNPALAGALILASFAAEQVLGGGASDLLMVAAAVVTGMPIALRAVRRLVARDVSIDLLVAVAATGAVVIGEYWEAAAVTSLFAVGHALEARTLNRTRSALAELVAVVPDVAVVLHDGEQVEVPAGAVAQGETVLVKNGAKVPVDGDVVAGTGAVDEASVTGESIPAEKAAGDRVYAGTVSRGGFLQVRATGVGQDTTLARIIHRVEEAQDAKGRTQTFIDRLATGYTPAVIGAALVVGLVTGDVVLALTLLVIGCPGALVISLPVAIVAGIGRAAKDGVLIKGGEFLETAATVDTVALDKTGTLTHGRPRLTDVVVLDETLDRQAVLAFAAVAEAGSEHPLARPVLAAAAEAGVAPQVLPTTTEPVPGKGVIATTDGHRVLVGTPALLIEHDIDPAAALAVVERAAAAGQTPMVVVVDGRVAGVLAVADTVRSDAATMVSRLRAAGVTRVAMLTGDAAAVAGSVGRVTGIADVRAGLLPEGKLDAVVALQSEGRTVAMVGDGVNDAPALAAADVGIAMGAAGSAVAVETADIALMSDDLLRLPDAIVIARRTVAVMRQNIVLALATVAVLLVGTFAGGVTIAIGMLVHEASVLLVIAHALRLLRPSPDREPPAVRRGRSEASVPRGSRSAVGATGRPS